MKKGKKYLEARKKLAEKEFYSIPEAIKMLKETTNTKFDSTAEIHLNLNIDPAKADQSIRGIISLPHGTGKKVRIAAVVTDDKVKAAKEAGADAAGLEDLIDEFSKGKVNYDVIVATSDVMKSLSKVAKILGQKGVMPSPKAGTVVDDIAKAVKELKAGRIEYRNDKQGNVHSIFGKASFKQEELENNLKSLLKVLKESKPASIKGTFVKSVTLTTTMGPGVKLDPASIFKDL